MLIYTRFLTSGDLQMDAYTYSLEEFEAVENTLTAAGVAPTYQQLPRDKAEREGRRYTAPSHRLHHLEAELEGSFLSTGEFVPAAGTGNNYACREISIGGQAKGCEDLVAPSDAVAQTKCALIARNKNWFGGVPGRGTCQRPNTMNKLFSMFMPRKQE
jgi:hypothetical protein